MPDFDIKGKADMAELVNTLKSVSAVTQQVIDQFKQSATISQTLSEALRKVQEGGKTVEKMVGTNVTVLKQMVSTNQQLVTVIRSVEGVEKSRVTTLKELKSAEELAADATRKRERVLASLNKQREQEQKKYLRVTGGLASQKEDEEAAAAKKRDAILKSLQKQREDEMARFSRVITGLAKQREKEETEADKRRNAVLSSLTKQREEEMRRYVRVVSSLARQQEREETEAARRAAAVIASLARQRQEEQTRYNRVVSGLANQRQKEEAKALRDNTPRNANDIVRESMRQPIKGFEKKDFDGVDFLDKNLNRVRNTLANLAIYRGFNAISNGLASAVSESREFNKALTQIRSITQDATTSTSTYGAIVSRVSVQAATDFKEVAAAAYDLASNQVASGSGLERALTNSANLALVTKSNIKDSANVISSALNAFGSSAGTQEEVAAKLFKTVDLGRVNIDQLSTSLGNVSSLASALGVEFEEILALLSTLTRRGISTSQSVVLINAAMEKLLKPTEEMKKAFDELGYASGRSAISTDGLGGTLSKLIGLADQGKLKLSELFNQEQSLKLAANFKSAVSDISTDLDKIKNKSQGSFNSALDTVKNTPAFRIEQNLTALKNAGAKEFGDSVNNILDKLLKLSGSTEEFGARLNRTLGVAKQGAVIIGALGGAVIALKLASQGVAAVQLIQATRAYATTVATTQQTVATNALTAAEQRLAASGAAVAARRSAVGALGATPILSAVTLIGSVVAANSLLGNELASAFNEAQDAVNEYVKRLKDKEAESSLKSQKTLVDGLTEGYKRAAAAAGRDLGQAIKISGDRVNSLNDKLRQNSENLKTAFVSYLDLAKNKVGELENRLGKTKTLIESIDKAKLRPGEIVGEERDKAFEQFGTDDQKEVQLEQRIKEKIAKAKELFKKGTTESVAEGRQLFEQAQRDVYRLESLRVERQKKAAEAAGVGGRVDFDLAAADREAKRIGAIANAEEDSLKARLKNRQKNQEEKIAIAKEEQKKLEQIAKEVAEFSPFDSTGKAKKEFADRFGNLDQAKVAAKFQEFRDRVGEIQPDALKDSALTKELQARQTLITNLLTAKSINDDLLASERKRLEVISAIEEATNRTKKALEDAANTSKDLVKSAQELLKAPIVAAENASKALEKAAFDKFFNDKEAGTNDGVKKASVRAVEAGLKGVKAVGNTLGFDTDTKRQIDIQIKQAEEAAARIRSRFADLPGQTENKNGFQIIKPEAIAAAQKELDNFLNNVLPSKIKSISATTGLSEEEVKKIIFGPNFDSVIAGYRAVAADLQKQFQTIQNKQAEATAATEQAKALEKLKTELAAVADKYDNIGKKSGQAFDPTRLTEFKNEINAALDKTATLLEKFDPTAKITESAKKANEELDKIKVKIDAMQIPTPQAPRNPGNVTDQQIEGIQAQGRAFGGPIGRDNIPIWASAGEYVLNPGATQRFYSQVTSMNSQGRIPQYFANGGPVTNMGGVTINVNESKSPGLTGRAIQSQLTRLNRLNGN